MAQERAHAAGHWHRLEDGRVQCDICPHACRLHEGKRGVCFVRMACDGGMVLTTYGRSSGFSIDPVEKKPLHHFLPGSPVLSFGTAGCNLSCRFCQNWDITKSRDTDRLAASATPEQIAEAAVRHECRGVAFTYNDPVIFHEYAIDVAEACRARGVRAIAVTAGYQNAAPRAEFYAHMDAANVDLKAFSDRFYRDICGAHLEPVLETLEYLHRETQVWLEVTTLLIPGENDGELMLNEECAWLAEHLGPQVPVHFTAFHPDWHMRDRPPTPYATLARARRIAHAHGLEHAYTGNVHDIEGGSTYCAGCNLLLIERNWYEIGQWHLTDDGHCPRCGTRCPGVFDGPPGTWGARSEPIEIGG
ncbi:MAG: AmmeMemoRadiSam system radical SAM enzyme [Opitutaceae bacterium]|nr:AmmeMemoRadiSam system radical SAM enzyme [Opitutaceae bacterium]